MAGAAVEQQLAGLSLSLASPSSALSTLLSLHRELLSVLQAVEALPPEQAASQHQRQASFARITGCQRAEASFYLQHAGGDMQAAVLSWHNQVLRDYLAAFDAARVAPPSYKQQAAAAAAAAMRAKAAKAAAAAEALPPAMAATYLRTNFCSICKTEAPLADRYLTATAHDLAAAVEEFIARHLLPPCEAGDPDAGLKRRVLVSRGTSGGGGASAGGGGGGGGSGAGGMSGGYGTAGSRAAQLLCGLGGQA